MALRHNSKVNDPEPPWGSVDKTKLPRNAHAYMGDPDKKSTWGYPHHWVKDGKVGEDGVFIEGDMYLHRGGLRAALQAAGGARSGQEASQEIKDHLNKHKKIIGMGNDAKASLNIEEKKNFKNGGNNMAGNTDTKIEDGINQDDLKKLEALEAENKILKETIANMNASSEAKSLKGAVDTLTVENSTLKAEIEKLKSESDFADLGKKALEALKAEVKTLAMQIHNTLTDEQLDAYVSVFGNDYDALQKTQKDLSDTKTAMLAAGSLNVKKASESDIKKQAKEDAELGRKIGEKGNF